MRPPGGNEADVSGRVFQLVDPAMLTQREYIEAAKKSTFGASSFLRAEAVLYTLALGVETSRASGSPQRASLAL